MDPASKPAKRSRAAKPIRQQLPAEVINKTKFEGYAEEMIEKTVRQSGRSGRVYLPQEWVGKSVKIIRLD